ncbi:MAG TPA: hypothetical protein VIK44_05560 [Acetobacterium sp.]
MSMKLTKEFGRGFTVSNLRGMRQFYCTFPIRNALRSELGTRQLDRQINNMYYTYPYFLTFLAFAFSGKTTSV